MKALLNEKPNIQKLRFWGKIFGIKNNYYIAEANFEYREEFFVSTGSKNIFENLIN